ncbi:c24314d0-54a7-4b87-9e1c-9fa5156454ae [Thermothielavioides terrestris]|uniref:C24314d0-54a7-4b87-9e1c-9fa5156454ae n=1 Tax=Thermothielavioides terrestris TaxID=2587410 RepID=A0A446B9I6_9PEZI|nr:c24314d0-54a7-4b87-9e1c-9fa5156454ae [Thermothielavioides terrestris]
MQGDPSCTWASYLLPQLRRFPQDGKPIHFRKFLGHGVEGCVARVKFGEDQDTAFALKTFFNSTTPQNDEGWWPLEREARLVAVLEKVQAQLQGASPEAVHVPVQRKSRRDCLRCLFAFSDESRRIRPFDTLPAEQRTAVCASQTRIRRCFGWTAVRGEDVACLNRFISIDTRALRKGEATASRFDRGRQYIGIVYEYVPKAALEQEAVRRQLDFFHWTGFQRCQAVKQANWQGPGMLLDFGDYNSPVDPWFRGASCYFPPAPAAKVVDPAAYDRWAIDEATRLRSEATKEDDERREMESTIKSKTARLVEFEYHGRQAPPWFLKLENGQTLTIEEDPLGSIVLPEIQPKMLRKAWRDYERLRRAYLSATAATAGTEGERQPA